MAYWDWSSVMLDFLRAFRRARRASSVSCELLTISRYSTSGYCRNLYADYRI